jgi:glycosyltransferase involved in cell wall biosynthesis
MIRLARIALLCEGDAESYDSAFSGTAKGVVDGLRQLGHQVATVDSAVYGWRRLALAARTFHPDRARWRARFQLGPEAFAARSRRAVRGLRERAAGTDVIFQIGATFRPAEIPVPYVLYCDWNMALTIREAAAGSSVAARLPTAEAAAINAREAEIYRGAGVVFSVSERLRQSFLEDYHLPPDRVCTVYAGANFDVSAIPERPEETPVHHVPTVLFVAKLFWNKGGDVLLTAFKEVRREVPNARLLVVGPSDLKLNEPGVELLGRLRKADPQENRRLMEAYLAADVLCLPTPYDAFPTVVREAMFFRLPCVTSDIWANPEMVQDGTTGYTVPSNAAAPLAERLIRLLRDPALARRMGEAGRRLAEERFTWSAVARRIHEQVQAVMAERSGLGT